MLFGHKKLLPIRSDTRLVAVSTKHSIGTRFHHHSRHARDRPQHRYCADDGGSLWEVSNDIPWAAVVVEDAAKSERTPCWSTTRQLAWYRPSESLPDQRSASFATATPHKSTRLFLLKRTLRPISHSGDALHECMTCSVLLLCC